MLSYPSELTVVNNCNTAGTVETLAGRCGEPGFEDGSGKEARFSSAIWDVYCAPHDCSVLVADPANGALRRITRDPRTCPKPHGEAHVKGAKLTNMSLVATRLCLVLPLPSSFQTVSAVRRAAPLLSRVSCSAPCIAYVHEASRLPGGTMTARIH